MRRTPLLIAAAAVAIAPLAACGGSDDKADTPAGTGSQVVVHASDALKFDKSAYEAKAGEVAFKYVNDGSTGHTLLIKQGDTPVPGFRLDTAGDKTGSVQLAAGTYTVFCDISGHGNMHAELTVK